MLRRRLIAIALMLPVARFVRAQTRTLTCGQITPPQTEGPFFKTNTPQRITLIGQLIYEVRNSTTPHGILMWFDRQREQLGGRTPRELLDADLSEATARLVPLARGGRAQLGM